MDLVGNRVVVCLLRSRTVGDLLNWPLVSWLEFLIAAVCLLAVVIAVIQLIARANKETDPAAAEQEMLLRLSELYREGDLTKEEFRSIKGQILQRLSAVSPVFPVVRKPAESASTGRHSREPDQSDELPNRPPKVTTQAGSVPENSGTDSGGEAANEGADRTQSGIGHSGAKLEPDER